MLVESEFEYTSEDKRLNMNSLYLVHCSELPGSVWVILTFHVYCPYYFFVPIRTVQMDEQICQGLTHAGARIVLAIKILDDVLV